MCPAATICLLESSLFILSLLFLLLLSVLLLFFLLLSLLFLMLLFSWSAPSKQMISQTNKKQNTYNDTTTPLPQAIQSKKKTATLLQTLR